MALTVGVLGSSPRLLPLMVLLADNAAIRAGVECRTYDKKKAATPIADVLKCDLVFICSQNKVSDTGTFTYMGTFEWLSMAAKNRCEKPIIIYDILAPGMFKQLKEKFPTLNLSYVFKEDGSSTYAVFRAYLTKEGEEYFHELATRVRRSEKTFIYSPHLNPDEIALNYFLHRIEDAFQYRHKQEFNQIRETYGLKPETDAVTPRPGRCRDLTKEEREMFSKILRGSAFWKGTDGMVKKLLTL